MGRHLELIDESQKTWKVNVQDIKITYPVDELIKCLPDEKHLDTQPSIVHIQNSKMTYGGHLIQIYYQIFENIIQGLPVCQLLMIKVLVTCMIQLSNHELHMLEQIRNKVSLKITHTLLRHITSQPFPTEAHDSK